MCPVNSLYKILSLHILLGDRNPVGYIQLIMIKSFKHKDLDKNIFPRKARKV